MSSQKIMISFFERKAMTSSTQNQFFQKKFGEHQREYQISEIWCFKEFWFRSFLLPQAKYRWSNTPCKIVFIRPAWPTENTRSIAALEGSAVLYMYVK